MSELTVLIPVYRSAEGLAELHRRIADSLQDLPGGFEILFVEDCGGDDSWQVIRSLAAADPRVRGIRMSRNYGQHNALLCGIRAARGEVILTMDDDLQHPPEQVHKLLAKLREGYDVVYGPPAEEQHGFFRNWASRITKLTLQSAMGAETAGRVSALRAFRARLRDAFDSYRGPFVNIDVLLTWGTAKFAAVAVPHEPRKYGTSGYTLRKLVNHAFNMMTGFSTIPLQIASVLGFVFALFGVGILAFVLARYFLLDYSVPGFPFVASIIAIFSGVQLFALGIIGEYLARTYFRTMDKPPYLVEATTDKVGLGEA